MDGATKNCFHCGGPLPETAIELALNKASEQVCSTACAAAAQHIYAAGLDKYYAHRDQPQVAGAPPADARDWSAYERPAVMREFVREMPDGTRSADLLIQGVHCAACTWLIETALGKVAGVISSEVNPVTTRAELRWNPAQVGLAALLEHIGNLGFTPVPFTGQDAYAAAERERRTTLRRLLVAGLGMMQVTSYAVAMYAGAFQGMDLQIETFLRLISLLVATPIVVYSGAPFFTGAWRNLRARKPGMDVPVALAIGGAWAASVWNTFTGSGDVYFDSATMFVFFLSGTRYLEAAGRFRALDLTHALAQQLPTTTLRISGTRQEEIGVLELEAGDRVLVRTGEAFPADGTVLEQATEVDESMLTGESLPVRRVPGDAVIAGTVNIGAPVQVNVSKVGPDTVLAQIGRLVTQAGRDRPQLVELTDRVASVFVAAVLVLAAATAAVWWQVDPERAFGIVLSVLVVTCPCALALATPAAFTVATGKLARDGFLVRRAGALQRLANVQRIIFDKTGTLTDNHLRIAAVTCRAGMTEAAALAAAAALEADSTHPVARAFRLHPARTRATGITAHTGGGLEGSIDDRVYRIGTAAFVLELGAAASAAHQPLAEPAQTDLRTIYLGDNSGVLARFDIVEHVRIGAAAMLGQLAELGITSFIASGDQPGPVRALARAVGNPGWRAGMLPEDKLALVRELQTGGTRVAAVGDGINDSPVLAGADVSIAMGSGTSIAQHSADCVWLGNQLTGLDDVFRIARKTLRIVRQNLVWALCYNVFAIPLAATGNIEPWMAALGMSLSSLLVMLNALRLGATSVKPALQQEIAAETPACCKKQAGAAA